MSIKAALFAGVVCGFFPLAFPLFAQETTGDPLSAIDWLSDVVREPEPAIAPSTEDITKDATPTEITTTLLGQVKTDAVGLLSSSVTGLPADFWGTTSTKELQTLIRAQRTDLPPPLSGFLRRLLLAELTPPPDSDPNGGLFLARIDKLLDMGALDEASALIERAGPTTPDLFRRWFDISLLTEREDQACRVMLDKPEIAPTYPARIFCLARGGDWSAAAVTLNTAKILNLININEEALMARFLDPELFEGEPPLAPPSRITPLAYRMHAAIGEPLKLSGLPNAFAFAATGPNEGWKQRITAAERLVRSGAMRPQQLMAIYKERAAAASGGVWDRVDAVQIFDAALLAGNGEKVSRILKDTLRPLRRAGLEAAFASVYGERLARLPLKEMARLDAIRVELMSNTYEAVAVSGNLPNGTPDILVSVATGAVKKIDGSNPMNSAISAAFLTDETPTGFEGYFADKKSGEIALRAMSMLQDGADGDPSSTEIGLRLLRNLGLEDLARRTALHLLLARFPQ
jgi:hypothetical protein